MFRFFLRLGLPLGRANDFDEAFDRAIDPHGREAGPNPQVLAVFGHAPVFQIEPSRFARFLHLLRRLPAPMLVIAIEHAPRAAHDLIAPVAEDALRAGVPSGDEALVVRADDREVGKLIDDGQNEVLGLLRSRTRRPTFARALVDDVNEERSSLIAAGDRADDVDFAVLPLLLDDPFLDAIAAGIAVEHLAHCA